MSSTIYQGPFYRYGTDGLLGVKKVWKQCFVVVQDDSTFSAYKNDSAKTRLYETKLSENTLWLAFGKDAEKYDPPKLDPNGTHVDYNYLIAIPKDKERESVAWFAAGSQQDFKNLLHHIAYTVKSKSKPPVLGGKRSENKSVSEKIRHIFNLGPNAEDWEVYWLAGSIGESGTDVRNKPPTPVPRRTPVSESSRESTPVPLRPNPPTPAVRQSLQVAKPLRLTESNVEEDDRYESLERNGTSPEKLHYQTNSPDERVEIVSEQKDWFSDYMTGKTIKTVECKTTKLIKN